MPVALMFFATVCVVVVMISEAMDLRAKRRFVDAGRSRVEMPLRRASLRK